MVALRFEGRYRRNTIRRLVRKALKRLAEPRPAPRPSWDQQNSSSQPLVSWVGKGREQATQSRLALPPVKSEGAWVIILACWSSQPAEGMVAHSAGLLHQVVDCLYVS